MVINEQHVCTVSDCWYTCRVDSTGAGYAGMGWRSRWEWRDIWFWMWGDDSGFASTKFFYLGLRTLPHGTLLCNAALLGVLVVIDQERMVEYSYCEIAGTRNDKWFAPRA